MTEKAFPEDESVITTAVNVRGTPGVSNEFAFEEKYGKRNQLGVAIPFAFSYVDSSWLGGVGDISIGWKRVLLTKLHTGTILGMQGEIILPAGNRSRGFGSGTTTFETFASRPLLAPVTTAMRFA